jgi:hypothetical protein
MEEKKEQPEKHITEYTKKPVILIGEYHEIKENVRKNTHTIISNIHNIFEYMIHRELIKHNILLTSKNPEKKMRICFINEGQDENERCNNLKRNINKITDNFYDIREFNGKNKKFMEVYYLSCMMEIIKIFEYTMTNINITFDEQYKKAINKNYFEYMLEAHRLISFFNAHETQLYDDITTNIVEYRKKHRKHKVPQNIIEAIQNLMSSVFERIKNDNVKSIISRINAENKHNDSLTKIPYDQIKNELRHIRDENIINNLVINVENYDIIVFYFGANHYDNLYNLINSSDSLKLHKISCNMAILRETDFNSSALHDGIVHYLGFQHK